MNYLNPIYTVATHCQDCYKCLRQCPVKAIEIQSGHAKVMQDMCICCGHCINICPQEAKCYRDDIDVVRNIIAEKHQQGAKVIVSLAPSFVSEFDIEPSALVKALKNLGFDGVSETALGAQEVSANIAEKINHDDKGIYISSACPTVVEMVNKYYPQYSMYVTDMLSPVLAHSKMLKHRYGSSTAIVFIGPCIAKKVESDHHPELLDGVLTFEELRKWLAAENVRLDLISDESEEFVPEQAQEGSLYPIDGGMIAGVKAGCSRTDASYMSFSGLDNVKNILEDLANVEPSGPLFIELLACAGGCINGPMMSERGVTVGKRYEVIEYSRFNEEAANRKPSINIENRWEMEAVRQVRFKESEIRDALRSVGKFSPEDELNCSGCGYDSCRAFAKAMIQGKAEPSMCVGNMRKLAHKKLDVLIRTIPCGILIVDEKQQIVESNRKFAEFLGEDITEIYDTCEGLSGAVLQKIVPFHYLFTQMIESGIGAIEKDIKINDTVINVKVFTIEPHRLVGCIAQDITEPSVQKDRIILKSKEVMRQNLDTVQKIAHLLGENASASEVLLESIVETFSAANKN